jgi:ureidoacrylate peracid hydrolase
MHAIVTPEFVIRQVIDRRGKEHVYDDLNPAKTAMVAVDLQNGFMMPGIAHALCEMAPEVVPNVNRIAGVLRATGGTVVWIKNAFNEKSLVSWSSLYAIGPPEVTAKRIESMSKGSLGHALWDALEVQPADLIVKKGRYSAFIQGSSNLAELLYARGVDTVVITGTVTNVCCEATARDAMMLNFRTIMVTDGCAANSDNEHNASLKSFYLAFGDIMSTEFLISCLERNASVRVAAI